MTTRNRRRKPAPADISSLGTFPPPTETSEQMAVDNRLLAMDMANRFARANRQQVADLETPAWVGLLKACRLYDPDKINPHTGRAYALSSFAVPYINGAMKQHVRDKTFAIKFPHRWRELGPKIRRLRDAGMTPRQVLEAIQPAPGVTLEEVEEILAARHSTISLDADFDHHGQPADDQLVADEEDQHAAVLFARALEIGRQAMDRICRADQSAIRAYWADAKRVPYPSGPLQQFRLRVRELVPQAALGGSMTKTALGFEVFTTSSSTRAPRRFNPCSRRTAAELTADAEQQQLFAMAFEPDESDGEP